MKEHKYAKFLRAIADGKTIQWLDRGETWHDLETDEALNDIADEMYEAKGLRIKPDFVLINGIEVPAPYRGEMKKGQRYWVANFFEKSKVESYLWESDEHDKYMRDSGVVYLEEKDAKAHAEALLSFTQKGE